MVGPTFCYTLVTSASILPGITFRARDEATGAAGLTTNIPAVGGSPAFSLTTQIARVGVNNAPVDTHRAVSRADCFNSTMAALLGKSVQDWAPVHVRESLLPA